MATLTSPTYDKTHASTVIAQTALVAGRFVGHDGGYATSAGGGHDCKGVSEYDVPAGEAVSLITGYSAIVRCAEPIAQWALVKPAADGTGRAAVGGAADRCGRALTASTAADQVVEVQLLPHAHP